MTYRFPSKEWTEAYRQAVNSNPAYAEAGKDWTHGTVALVVKADPTIGIEKDMAMLLDVHRGVCRSTRYDEAEKVREEAAFVVEAGYDLWREVIDGKLDPTKGMMQGKLRLTKGHLPTMIRYVQSSKQLVASAAQVPTDFLR
ncbi:MAG: SCP2 sterol-binding domain-containing protein [Deltaproteobacteria bacterium]|nr:SCP2 sterol-binding domain-containing protein [Deltaproteobacteria bacterium]